MSRAFVRRAELRRALLRAGPHVGSANRAGATNSALAGRPLSAQAPGLHQPPVGGRGGNSWRDRYHASNGGAGAAAVVVAGSVTLFVLSQLDVAEELLPSLSKKSGNNGGDASSPKRIEDVSRSREWAQIAAAVPKSCSLSRHDFERFWESRPPNPTFGRVHTYPPNLWNTVRGHCPKFMR